MLSEIYKNFKCYNPEISAKNNSEDAHVFTKSNLTLGLEFNNNLMKQR